MKKRKFCLWLNVVTICLSICAIAIGVYSIKTATLNVNGSIGFTAHNCKVRVLGKITGAVDASNNAITSNTETATINYTDSSDTSKGKLIEGPAEPWNFGSIFFDDLNTDKYHEVNDIVFTFTITNESAYYVDVTVNQDCINNNRIFIYAPNNGETLSPQGQDGSSVTLTVKLQLQKVNGEYSSLDHAISLSNATLLNFTKSQAPSYLATDWKDKITSAFTLTDLSYIASISFLRELKTDTLTSFNKTPISVGAVNETSNAGNLTTSVSDVVAYYDSDNGKIVVHSPARIYAPQDCSYMFYLGREYALSILDFSNFDTSKVKTMDNMFYDCGSLTSLDISNFDTSSVENMCGMFDSCSVLTSLDVSNFNTSKVTRMELMFSSCRALTSLDLSNFDTSSVTRMNSMFAYCSELKTIYVNSSKWSTASVTDSSNMFLSCTKLPNFNSSVVDKTNAYTGAKGYLTEKA